VSGSTKRTPTPKLPPRPRASRRVSAAIPGRTPETVGFVLAPKFSLLAVACAIEPLRVANRMARCELYRWEMISLDGKAVVASNGTPMRAVRSIREPANYALVVVCAGFDPESLYDARLAERLRVLDRAGVPIGAIDTGAFVLAHCDMLNGYRATAHWESLECFQSEFSRVLAAPELYVIDRSRFTCAGGTAALDMMLHLVRLRHGHRLAAAVAEQFIHTRIREPKEHQRMRARERQAVNDPWLVKIIDLMEANLEEPLPVRELCRAVGIHQRRCERAFRQNFRMSARRYYLNLRLQRARSFLQYTNLRICDAAVACGFHGAPHFSRCYKAWAGRTPLIDRRLMHAGLTPALA
jgi:transcriptional regulator GlxA family with amidase domain